MWTYQIVNMAWPSFFFISVLTSLQVYLKVKIFFIVHQDINLLNHCFLMHQKFAISQLHHLASVHGSLLKASMFLTTLLLLKLIITSPLNLPLS